jgi:hypothetical protein
MQRMGRGGREGLTDLWVGHLERVGHELPEAEAVHHHLLRRRVHALDQHLGRIRVLPLLMYSLHYDFARRLMGMVAIPYHLLVCGVGM